MDKEFSASNILHDFIEAEEERHPGFKEGLRKRYENGPPRDIKSEPPAACINGEYECYVPTSGWRVSGETYQCKLCKKRFIYYIPPSRKDGTWETQKSGWYLRNDSVLDIIKSWFTSSK